MSKREKIKKLLAKLLRQAEGERKLGNLEAADAFAARVQELALKYRIEPRVDDDEEEGIHWVVWETKEIGAEFRASKPWLQRLACAIGLGHRTRVMSYPGDASHLAFVGFDADILTSAAMMTILARAMLDAFHEYSQTKLWIVEPASLESFAQGFADSIYDRYAERKTRLEEQANAQALVCLAERQVDDALAGTPTTTIPPAEGLNFWDYDSGFRAGSEQSLEAGLIDPAKEKQ
jgi:hypothetical protein